MFILTSITDRSSVDLQLWLLSFQWTMGCGDVAALCSFIQYRVVLFIMPPRRQKKDTTMVNSTD